MKAERAHTYTQTVVHEVRTPLLSIIFFLKVLIAIFKASSISSRNIKRARRTSKLMMGQCKLM